MSSNKKVLIFGGSLNLAGIGACLMLEKGLDVVVVDPQSSFAKQLLAEANPEVILFDLSGPSNDLDMGLLRKRPDLLLIGVDASSDEVLVFRGQRSRVVTAAELSQLISNRTDDKQAKRKHDGK